MKDLPRCPWCGSDGLYQDYHDRFWGQPCRDEAALFQLLILEGHQAGLRWIDVLRRVEAYRQAYAGFDPKKLARFSEARQAELMQQRSIIRNRLKIASAVNNARRWLELKEKGDPVQWLWETVEGQPVINRWRNPQEVPTQTEVSRQLSKRLKAAGFTFVGPRICYAFMQASGMVNDHLTSCWRHPDFAAGNPSLPASYPGENP